MEGEQEMQNRQSSQEQRCVADVGRGAVEEEKTEVGQALGNSPLWGQPFWHPVTEEPLLSCLGSYLITVVSSWDLGALA